MRSVETLELALLLASHGQAVADAAGLPGGGAGFAPAALGRYWAAARSRHDAWGHDLKRLAGASPADLARRAPRAAALVEEVLAADVLLRVWTAVLCLCDRRHGQGDAGPVARAVYSAHVEARQRALRLLVASGGLPPRTAVGLDRLRRQTERWADVMLGRLAAHGSDAWLLEFAASSARAADFAEGLRGADAPSTAATAWTIHQASLRAAFRTLGRPPAHPEHGERVAAAILGCLPSELFDGAGLPRSLWPLRLAAAASDAQGMIDALCQLEAPPLRGRPGEANAPGGPRPPRRFS
jgi:hypothetical protein